MSYLNRVPRLAWWLLAGVVVIAGLVGWSRASKAADKGGPHAQPVVEQPFYADAPITKTPQSWSGLYVGVHGGYDAADGKIASFDGVSATGWVGGIDAGFDVQMPHTCVVAGVRGSYTWGDVKTTVGSTSLVSIKDGWSGDARLGCSMGSALPYIFGGWAQNVHTAGALPLPDLKGWRTGGGVEFLLPNAFTGWVRPTLALEYVHTDYDKLLAGALKVTDEAVMARLNLRFGK